MKIGSVRSTLDNIRSRREIVINGGSNSIPSPLRRFSGQYVGVERGTYYLLTSGTKGGKTQLTCYLFVFEPLLSAFRDRSIDIRIFYFPLEETKERIVARYISYLLYIHKGIEVPYKELMSVGNKPLSEDILAILEEDIIKEQLKFFDEHVEFVEGVRINTGIYRYMRQYAESTGTIHYREVESEDGFGTMTKDKVFDRYEPNNKEAYTLFIIDHISLISGVGQSRKQAIDAMSESCVELTNRYGFSPVVVQQQAFVETSENMKSNLTRPTLTNLSDSKYTSRDCHVALGLYAPFRYKIDKHLGYDLNILRDSYRSLEVLANRNGEIGGIIGLLFNGAVSYFDELPKPYQEEEINRVYDSVENKRKQKQEQETLF